MNILAICGSTRQRSSNLNIIKAIAALYPETLAITLFEGLEELPSFNPDKDNDQPPAAVAGFRKQISEAAAVLICTPEYAMGVPGVLKNAIDWTVSSMEFSGKPVALITASTSGKKGHQSLLDTLLVIESKMTAATHLIIPFPSSKLNDQLVFTEQNTLKSVQALMDALIALINSDPEQPPADLLPPHSI